MRASLLLRLVVGALLLLAVAVPSTASAAKVRMTALEQCPGADLAPDPGNLHRVERAILCLHNRDRALRKLPPLRRNAKLAAAARRHSDDMVASVYFSHDSPSGSGLLDRIRRTGYLRATRNWTVGENIAWGSSHRATALEIEQAWMASPAHRANILRRQYREIGFGVTLGSPVDGPQATPVATYTADFGVRR